MTPLAVVVAGPTCSGKSALALALAERLGGTVINADSMQVYRELRVMTARPTPEDEARVPHELYGVQLAAEAASVAWWRARALDAMRQAAGAGRLPILCGGTGLYFQALTKGLSPIPDPGPEARAEARALLADEGPAALHARLVLHDPETASMLRPSDGQRLARAWEVWSGTGRGMAAWHARQETPTLGWRLCALRLDPPRERLRAAIAERFETMLRQGGLSEVDALLAQGLDPSLPAMRAHGVPELSAYRRGAMTLAEAGLRTRLVTGQYTKRQATWFRHHDNAAGSLAHSFVARYEAQTQESEIILHASVRFILNAIDGTPPPP